VGTLAGLAAADDGGAAGVVEPAGGADPGAAGGAGDFDAAGGVTGTCASAAVAIAASQTKHIHALFLNIRKGYVACSFTSEISYARARNAAAETQIFALERP